MLAQELQALGEARPPERVDDDELRARTEQDFLLRLDARQLTDVAARLRHATVQTADGLARGKLIAGAALGVNAVIETHTPIVFQDWTLEPGADVTIASRRTLSTTTMLRG